MSLVASILQVYSYIKLQVIYFYFSSHIKIIFGHLKKACTILLDRINKQFLIMSDNQFAIYIIRKYGKLSLSDSYTKETGKRVICQIFVLIVTCLHHLHFNMVVFTLENPVNNFSIHCMVTEHVLKMKHFQISN